MSPTQTIYVQSELRGAQSLKPESLNLVQKLLLLFLTYSASKIVFMDKKRKKTLICFLVNIF